METINEPSLQPAIKNENVEDLPRVGKLEITKSITAKVPEIEWELVGEIAANDLRKGEIFKKYGIDFCCGGKKQLKEVCLEKGISYERIKEELNNVEDFVTASNNYNDWSTAFLADYIYNQHHKYFYREDLAIKELMLKIVGHHATNHPFLNELDKSYAILSLELNNHFIKEEQLIFPTIRILDYISTTGQKGEAATLTPLSASLHLMEADHEDAGKLLLALRKLTNDYSPPVDACNSFRLLYKKLSDLESDLHLHIHLENNILFPAAIALEKK